MFLSTSASVCVCLSGESQPASSSGRNVPKLMNLNLPRCLRLSESHTDRPAAKFQLIFSAVIAISTLAMESSVKDPNSLDSTSHTETEDTSDESEPELASVAMYKKIFQTARGLLNPTNKDKVKKTTNKHVERTAATGSCRKRKLEETTKIETIVVDEQESQTGESHNSISKVNKEVEMEVQRIIRQNGNLILCQVVLQGRKYPLRLYEKESIRDVREKIITKTGIQMTENQELDLFYGDCTILSDEKLVMDYGIKCLDDIDAFIKAT